MLIEDLFEERVFHLDYKKLAEQLAEENIPEDSRIIVSFGAGSRAPEQDELTMIRAVFEDAMLEAQVKARVDVRSILHSDYPFLQISILRKGRNGFTLLDTRAAS